MKGFKQFWKKKRAVSLITLSITIAIMLIIIGTITFSAIKVNETKEVDTLYANLNVLKDKVNIYYWRYGKLPVTTVYEKENIEQIEEAGVLNPNDYGEYYILDTEALENISDTTTQNMLSFFNKEEVNANEICYRCGHQEMCKKARKQKCF